MLTDQELEEVARVTKGLLLVVHRLPTGRQWILDVYKPHFWGLIYLQSNETLTDDAHFACEGHPLLDF